MHVVLCVFFLLLGQAVDDDIATSRAMPGPNCLASLTFASDKANRDRVFG